MMESPNERRLSNADRDHQIFVCLGQSGRQSQSPHDQQLLASLPDGRLLQGLRDSRGRGRDDYPVSVLWGVVLLRIILRHVSFEAVLAELRRNAGLAELIGIHSEKEVPKAWNISRFLEVLGQEPHRSHLQEVFAEMLRRLGQAVPDLGRHSAGDSTALHARGTRNAKTAAAETARGLPNRRPPQGVHGRPGERHGDRRVVRV
jgi:hypothetical protein